MPVLLIAGMALLTGCGGSGGGGNGSAVSPTRSASISVVGMNFGAPITVTSGTVVTWNNNSDLPHNVVWDTRTPSTAPSPGSNIGTFQAGKSVSWTAPTVTESSTYAYHCSIHGPIMSSSITVTP